MQRRLGDVPAEKQRVRITMNGKVLDESVASIQIEFFKKPGHDEKDRLGLLEYGMYSSGNGSPLYDDWTWSEAGGAIVLPYAIKDKRILIGLVREYRAKERHPENCPDGYVWNAPRGFVDADKTLLETAHAELGQEVGVIECASPIQIGEELGNPNNTFFAYDDRPEMVQGGIGFFVVEIPEHALVQLPGTSVYTFREGFLRPREPGSFGEKILRCNFWPWDFVVNMRCMMTMSAVSRLLNYLNEENRIRIQG